MNDVKRLIISIVQKNKIRKLNCKYHTCCQYFDIDDAMYPHLYNYESKMTFNFRCYVNGKWDANQIYNKLNLGLITNNIVLSKNY